MASWLSRSIRLALYVASVILGLLVLSSLIVYVYARPHIVSERSELASAQTAIILGAGVYQDGRLTPVLQERVDTAVSLYRAGLADKILMSGDNGSRDYNEVVPVREYLLAAGVPPADVFLDYAGFDTYDTMYRARAVFEVESAIVVTQSFHLPRAVFIAEALGIDVQGYASDDKVRNRRYSLRETLARVKAVLEVGLARDPAYLGQRIPITGDGRQSVGE